MSGGGRGAEAIGERRVAAVLDRIEAALRAELPGARVTRDEGRLSVSGRGVIAAASVVAWGARA